MFRKFIKASLYFLFLSLIFSCVYSQHPLYSFNQNIHFLHGLAKAGLGSLNDDWVAKTEDHFPVFSSLVYITYRYLNENMFYFYYIVILGIYIYSILGIASTVYNINSSKSKYFVYLALIATLHSAVLSYFVKKAFGTDLLPLLHHGVAGHFILGPVFQPSTFGVFLVFSIYLFIRKRPFWAVFFSVLAATMHVRNVWAVAVLTLSYMISIFKEQKNIKKALLIGLFAFISILPILRYLYIFYIKDISPEVASKAMDIFVNYRGPHQALPQRWFNIGSIIQIIIMIAAIWLVRKKKDIFIIMSIPFSVATSFTIFQVFTGNKSLAFQNPCYLSSFLVPISTCIVSAYITSKIFEIFQQQVYKYRKGLISLSLIIIFALAIGGVCKFVIKYKRHYNPMMEFVKTIGAPGQVYLIPPSVKLENFRLYTGVPIFVDKKTIPFKFSAVEEWYKRMQIVINFYKTYNNIDCNILKKFFSDYGITHLVMKNRQMNINCGILQELYKDDEYVVYELVGRD